MTKNLILKIISNLDEFYIIPLDIQLEIQIFYSFVLFGESCKKIKIFAYAVYLDVRGLFELNNKYFRIYSLFEHCVLQYIYTIYICHICLTSELKDGITYINICAVHTKFC